MNPTLLVRETAEVGFQDALDLEWRTIESRCIAPSQLIGTRQANKNDDPTRSRRHESLQRKSPILDIVSTSSCDNDAFKKTILHGHSPCTPLAWKFFDSWCPQESNMTMSIAHFDSCMPSSLRVGDLATKKRLSGAQYDDDICLKAAVKGWEAVNLDLMDPGWEVLKALDFALLFLCGVIERIAMLRLLRAVLAKIIYPFSATRSTFPSYMAAGGAQASSTAAQGALISMLIWPSLRSLLISRKTTQLPDHFLIQYFRTLRFSWPLDVRDAYKVNTRTGALAFTNEFDRRYNCLSSWTLLQYEVTSQDSRNGPEPRTGSKRPRSPSTATETSTTHSRSVRKKPEIPSLQAPTYDGREGSEDDFESNLGVAVDASEDSAWVARAWSDLDAATQTMFRGEDGPTEHSHGRASDSTRPLPDPEWFAPYAVDILSVMATDEVSLNLLSI